MLQGGCRYAYACSVSEMIRRRFRRRRRRMLLFPLFLLLVVALILARGLARF